MENNGIFCAFCDSKLFDEDRVCPRCGAPTKSAVVIKKEDKNKNVKWYKSSNNNYLLPQVESFSFIAGDEQLLEFNVYQDATSIPIKDGKLIWSLISYETNNNILLKTTAIKSGRATIDLKPEDTSFLRGKFIQSLHVENSDGVISVMQGMVTIIGSVQ